LLRLRLEAVGLRRGTGVGVEGKMGRKLLGKESCGRELRVVVVVVRVGVEGKMVFRRWLGLWKGAEEEVDLVANEASLVGKVQP
jgi:hypothetical protein